VVLVDFFNDLKINLDHTNLLKFSSYEEKTSFFDSRKVNTQEIPWDRRNGVLNSVEGVYNTIRTYNYMRVHNKGKDTYYFITNVECVQEMDPLDLCNLTLVRDTWMTYQEDIIFDPSMVVRKHLPRFNGNNPIWYPNTEGAVKYSTFTNLSNHRSDFLCYIITTSKRASITTEVGIDGIFNYLTFTSRTSYVPIEDRNGIGFVNIDTQLKQFSTTFNIATDAILSIKLIPFAPFVSLVDNVINLNPLTGGLKMALIENDGYAIGELNIPILPITVPDFYEYSETLTLPYPTKPTFGVSANEQYEPMMFRDNIYKFYVTDFMGNKISEFPIELTGNTITVKYTYELRGMNPQMRVLCEALNINNGFETTVPFIDVDIPNSPWLDYIVQSKTLDKQIFTDQQKTAMYTSIVGAVGGNIASGAMVSAVADASYGGPIGFGTFAVGEGTNFITAEMNRRSESRIYDLNQQKIQRTSGSPGAGISYGWVVSSLHNKYLSIGYEKGDVESRNTIVNNYQRFGYLVNRLIPVLLDTRRKYEYIQTNDAQINGNLPSDIKAEISAIFDKGCTIWHSADFTYIGDYSLDNTEVS
jgi:hypothetical protein